MIRYYRVSVKLGGYTMKRFLNCTASDFQQMNGQDLVESIRTSEGRIVLSEVIPSFQPLYREVSNMELIASFGADLILLNLIDVFNPVMEGVPNEGSIVQQVKNLTGRPVGVNLEPVDPNLRMNEQLESLPIGRRYSKETVEKAMELGFDYICFTGNPRTGVSNKEIISAVRESKRIVGDDLFIIAGKMHGAGVTSESGSGITNESTIKDLVTVGADVILIPSPGTVPGVSVENVQNWTSYIHEAGALAMLTIGTSQEGATEDTIRQIALQNKMAGADIHHIGDAGYNGVAVPENIMEYSIAIRGKRHTYVRMARSINR